MKVTTMLTQKALRDRLSPKQKTFVENLDREGATFTLKATTGYPQITNIVRKPRTGYYGHTEYGDVYEDDGYPSFGDTQAMGFWGD